MYRTIQGSKRFWLTFIPWAVCASLSIPFANAVEPILPKMVSIPAGTFIYGATTANDNHFPFRRWDIPQKTVDCATFSIAIYETTHREYIRFVQDDGYKNPHFWSAEGNIYRPEYEKAINPNRFPSNDLPVAGTSYYEAEAYCRWLALKTGEPYRLPTEIEWEKTARGTDGRIYPWGNRWDPKACNWCDHPLWELEPDGKIDGHIFAAPCGSYPEGVSPYGSYDMAGNVEEWCADWIDVKREFRVIRGGCYWMAYPRCFQTFFRSGAAPETSMISNAVTGFRIAKGE